MSIARYSYITWTCTHNAHIHSHIPAPIPTHALCRAAAVLGTSGNSDYASEVMRRRESAKPTNASRASQPRLLGGRPRSCVARSVRKGAVVRDVHGFTTTPPAMAPFVLPTSGCFVVKSFQGPSGEWATGKCRATSSCQGCLQSQPAARRSDEVVPSRQ